MQNLLIRNIHRKAFAVIFQPPVLSSERWQESMSLWRSLSKYGVVVLLCILFNLGASIPAHAASPGGGLQTPAQLLKKSVDVTKLLKSFSFATDMAATTAISDTTGSPQSISFIIKATGVWVHPDQIQTQLSIKSDPAAQVLTLSEVIVGHKLYIQNPKGQWYVLDNSSSGTSDNPFFDTNIAADNDLSILTTNATIKDNGTVILNGTSVRHLTLTLNRQVLKDRLNRLEKSLHDVIVKKAIIDIWIDEATSYIQQLQTQLELVTSITGVSSSKPSAANVNVNITIAYSKFNDGTLKVTVPAKAIPFPTGNP